MKKLQALTMFFILFTTFSSNGETIRMADKNFIINQLQKIFTDETNLEDFEKLAINNFEKNRIFFAEACDPYETLFHHEKEVYSGATSEYFKAINIEKKCNSINDLSTKPNYSESPGRLGVVIKTCLELTNLNSSYLEKLMKKVCGKISCEFNMKNSRKIYKLFYPFKEVSNKDILYIHNLFIDETPVKSIQHLTLSVCISPEWQHF